MSVDMKKYIDIEVLRDADVDLGGGLFRKRNDLAFHVGDIISITEKLDGSNASTQYNDGKMLSFSRRQPLDELNTLAGFYTFVSSLNPKDYADTPDYVIFGEWLRKNKISYNDENMLKWYIYSIYDKKNEKWLSVDEVKEFAKSHGLTYVHEFYYGPFISWEHCRSFMNMPQYGDRQEGIVVRNITALSDENNRYPHILKIVNEDFAETMKSKVRVVDPAVEAAKAESRALMESIVTKNRVKKELLKMRDDGILPNNIEPEHMGIVAKNLPKRIIADCVKEENEIFMKAGEYAGKMCASISMQIARDILLG